MRRTEVIVDRRTPAPERRKLQPNHISELLERELRQLQIRSLGEGDVREPLT